MAKQRINPTQIRNDHRWRVYASAGIAMNTGLPIAVFNSKNYDPLNMYSTSTGKVTIIASGLYMITARMSAAAAARSFLNIVPSVSQGMRGSDFGNNAEGTGSIVSAPIYLQAGETVHITAYCAASATSEFGENLAFFSGALIGT